jgi:hypothetical protein
VALLSIGFTGFARVRPFDAPRTSLANRKPVFRRRIPRVSGCLVIAFTLAAAVARADELEGRELFDRARELRLRGDCEGAMPLFRQAYGAYPAGLGSLRNIAECEEALGHVASARRAWTDLGHALVGNHESKYDGWAADAAGAEARLAPKDLATGTLEVHAVTPRPPDRGAIASHDSTQRTAAWIAAGVGAAGLVGMVIAAIARQSALDDLKAECGSTTTCPPAQGHPAENAKVRSIEDSGHTAATSFNVFAVVAAVGLSAGVLLYATDRSRTPHAGLLVSPAGIFAVGSY